MDNCSFRNWSHLDVDFPYSTCGAAQVSVVVALDTHAAAVDRPASVEPFRKNELLHPHVAPTNINDSISNMDSILCKIQAALDGIMDGGWIIRCFFGQQKGPPNTNCRYDAHRVQEYRTEYRTPIWYSNIFI